MPSSRGSPWPRDQTCVGHVTCIGRWVFFFFTRIPGGLAIKNPPAKAEDEDLIPGLGRSPREGNGNHSRVLAWEIS